MNLSTAPSIETTPEITTIIYIVLAILRLGSTMQTNILELKRCERIFLFLCVCQTDLNFGIQCHRLSVTFRPHVKWFTHLRVVPEPSSNTGEKKFRMVRYRTMVSENPFPTQ